jgi:hypothetical protein
MAIKPILFNTVNTEMVRAILDGRKSCTRRVVKPQPTARYGVQCIKPPYQPGDILYIRETWSEGYEDGTYIYKADDKLADLPTFKESSKLIYHPSIHMPKEAARIWLKVTDVRVERLQEISAESALAEGTDKYIHTNGGLDENMTITSFIGIWNSTIKKSDIDRYGWDANPWVWVIEFERCEKPKGV